MDVWQMERVMISYVSVDVVVAAHGGQRLSSQSCSMPASLTSLSVRAYFHHVNHDDDLDTDPLATFI